MTNGMTQDQTVARTLRNTGTECLKIKSPDMIGHAQWSVMRNKRAVRVEMLHQAWLHDYHARKHALLPGDSLECRYEETIDYNQSGEELARRLYIVEVLAIIRPPAQMPLID